MIAGFLLYVVCILFYWITKLFLHFTGLGKKLKKANALHKADYDESFLFRFGLGTLAGLFILFVIPKFV